MSTKDTMQMLGFALLLVIVCVLPGLLLFLDKPKEGAWGNHCKNDNTCNSGLVCVYDNHGYSQVNRRSLCVDPRTMQINGR